MLLRENAPQDNLTTVLVIAGFLGILYACMLLVRCSHYYTKNPDQLPYVIEKGDSTAVNVTAHLYQLQPPRHRKPNSPKDSCPV
jgi:hypothetical protein